MAVDGGLILKGSRKHLHHIPFWKMLDEGEMKLRGMFPGFIIHTNRLASNTSPKEEEIALITLYRYKTEKPGPVLFDNAYEMVIQLEEPIRDFPSEHLITQLMLVAG